LEEVRGASGLLELGEMVEIEAKHAPGVVAVHPSELERLNTILKAGFAGVAARAAELARAREKEATMSLRWQLSRANSEWANALRRRGESKPSL
jgi:thiamine monophosphate synthase